MPKAWKDVIATEQFQALNSDQQEAAQEQYFNDVITPQATGKDLAAVRAEFYKAYPPKGDAIDAVVEPVQAIGGSVLGAIGGGLNGIYELLTTGDVEGAARAVQDVQQYMQQASAPDTQSGQSSLTQVSNQVDKFGKSLRPIAAAPYGVMAGVENAITAPFTDKTFNPIDTAVNTYNRVNQQGIGEVLGDDAFEATGSPAVATAFKMSPDIAETVIPGGIAAKASRNMPGNPDLAAPSKAAQAERNRMIALIQNKVADKETAKLMLDEKSTAGNGRLFDQDGNPIPQGETGLLERFKQRVAGEQPKLKKDTTAIEAIKQGFDEGVIAAIKTASDKDKAKMLEMTNIMERGKKNQLYAMKNRPSDVAGDSLMNRVEHILKVNRSAGQQIDKVAKSLKGQQADFDTPVREFLNQLDDMGITIGPNRKPQFMGSDIEGVKGAEAVITNIVNRMTNTRVPDAYDMHRLKKYIDEQVTYGKNAEGLAGKAEIILKKLRRGIDSQLDESFPEYNKVNTVYADTINALDSLQDSVSGKKMDFDKLSTSKRLGGELRKLMSNYNSRINLLDSIEGIDAVAKKYKDAFFSRELSTDIKPSGNYKAPDFDDDLLMQALYVDELNRQFGTVARTSFAGETAKGVKQAMEGKQGLYAAAADKVGETVEKARGINDENAFKSIKQLLNRNTQQ